MANQTYLFIREDASRGEVDCAVTVRLTADLGYDDALQALKRAVTDWASEHLPDAADLNIGDLMLLTAKQSSTLMTYLDKQGIQGIECENHDFGMTVPFDLNLLESSE